MVITTQVIASEIWLSVIDITHCGRVVWPSCIFFPVPHVLHHVFELLEVDLGVTIFVHLPASTRGRRLTKRGIADAGGYSFTFFIISMISSMVMSCWPTAIRSEQTSNGWHFGASAYLALFQHGGLEILAVDHTILVLVKRLERVLSTGRCSR